VHALGIVVSGTRGNKAYGEGKVCVVLEEDGYCSTEISEFEGFDITVVNEDSTICGVVDT